jgi:uncharacterized phage protein (TIGR01671 family)
MRELKFRAWYNNKMWEVNSVDWVEYDDNPAGAYLFGLEGWVIVADKYMKPNSGVAILMQYTGLKDSNEKEIYEGDIIERDIGGDHCFVVEFGEGMFYADGAVSFPEKPYNYEIIGNKFENPELIEEE